jgi:SAM-dependent methyltransferase
MEPQEYATMAELESSYWWYRGQRDMVLDCLSALPRDNDAPILDAGCGTGRLARRAAEALSQPVIGIDLPSQATSYWHGESEPRLGMADINHLPFADRSFAGVYCVDVLCCRGVDAQRACNEFARVLRPAAHLLLVVPAYQWLLSEHDRAVHCVRRFNNKEVRPLLERAGLAIRRVTHMFPTFFPIIAATRLWRKAARSAHSAKSATAMPTARSDVRPLPRIINDSLYSLTQIERRIFRHANFRFGTSLLIVAQRPA